MSLKNTITASYGASIYKMTLELKEAKKGMAKAKNQFIFLQRCVKHKVIPKSLRIKSPLSNAQSKRITQQYRLELLVCAKNEAKKWFFTKRNFVSSIRIDLPPVLSENDMALIDEGTEKARETMFKRPKERLVSKFISLQDKKIVLSLLSTLYWIWLEMRYLRTSKKS